MLVIILMTISLCIMISVSFGSEIAKASDSGDPSGNEILINSENFEDEVFRVYVKTTFDLDQSESLDAEEISRIKRIDLKNSLNGSLKISSLKGIEYFTNLEYIDCMYQNLSAIDVSSNANLKTLKCASNKLTSLDVSNNPNLTILDCSANKIESLDVSHNNKLRELYCGCYNKITKLDVSKNTELVKLDLQTQHVGTLDLHYCTKLTNVICYDCGLTSLNVSGLKELVDLNCNTNQITSLDLSQCTSLTDLTCMTNQLESLDIRNCSALKKVECYDNKLTEIKTGYAPALSTFRCNINQLKSLDLSGLTGLQDLSCNNNMLTELDVTGNYSLRNLFCYENDLRSLDISKNDVLRNLQCNNNQLEKLDIGNNSAIEYLYCYSNKLKELKTDGNPRLKQLLCRDNQLTELNIYNMNMLETLEVDEGVNVINTPPTSNDNGGGSGNTNAADDQGNDTPGGVENTDADKDPVQTQTVSIAQKISGKAAYTKSIGKQFRLDAKGRTALVYKTSNRKIATVDSRGIVTIKGYGKCRITVTAKASAYYKSATKIITVKGVLAKPKLKAAARRGGMVKLTWSKVEGADGYKVYIKAPGSKKFRLAVTKNKKVKGVTNRGLMKGRKYSYKVRAFKKVGGKTVYSRYTKVVRVKVKN